MVDSARRVQIDDCLDRVEDEHGVTVLYACESGSRAWGFPSTDSDYDVRFVYAHPRDWYLSIDLARRDDTIDLPIEDEIDLHGWDLRKALGLFRTANPTLLDWLQSPIVYREDPDVMDRWREWIPDYYTPRAAGHAYRGLARSVAEQNLSEEPIPHKAYLYVLRALLAVRWAEQDRGPVPVEFERLVATTVENPALRAAIDDLLAQKKAGTEQDVGPRLPTLHDFIEAELERQADAEFPDSPSRPGPAPLNDFFRTVLDRRIDARR
jgi:predicted nucleotidyltransferase